MVLAARPKRKVTITDTRTIASTDGWTSRPMKNYHYRGMRVVINRSAETGTATLAAQIQFKSPLGTWTDLEGAAITTWADSAVEARSIVIYPGITAADADASIALDTDNDHLCGQPAPMEWRLVLTTTGTTNVVAAGVEYFN